MTPRDWRDWAEIFRTGERATQGWFNDAAPVLGSVLMAMARQCDATADERNDLREDPA